MKCILTGGYNQTLPAGLLQTDSADKGGKTSTYDNSIESQALYALIFKQSKYL